MVLLAACSPETPAPPAPAETPRTPAASTAPAPPARAVQASYDEAMTWLRSTPGFAFEMRDAEVSVTGRMTRKTIGAESVELKAGSDEWRATAGPRGITWELKKNGQWSPAQAPAFGNRVYQRVTLAIDPQKKEGPAQLTESTATSNLYRFTNANTGEVHEVWVAKSDGHIERMKIGETFEMTLTP